MWERFLAYYFCSPCPPPPAIAWRAWRMNLVPVPRPRKKKKGGRRHQRCPELPSPRAIYHSHLGFAPPLPPIPTAVSLTPAGVDSGRREKCKIKSSLGRSGSSRGTWCRGLMAMCVFFLKQYPLLPNWRKTLRCQSSHLKIQIIAKIIAIIHNNHFITQFTVHLMWLVLVPITIVQDK